MQFGQWGKKDGFKNIWGHVEHLIVAGTIEEKEKDDGKRNHNYAERHLVFTEHLLRSRSFLTHRADPSNTQWNPPENQVNTNGLTGTLVN